MNNYILNNLPSSNRKDIGFKSPNSSHVQNKMQDEFLNDVLDLFNKTNKIERVLNEQMNYTKLESGLMESINYAILCKYKELSDLYDNLTNTSSTSVLSILPYECKIEESTSSAVIDNMTSDITVRPSKKISKFVLLDSITDKTFVPDSLSVSINNINSQDVISTKDSDKLAPFYKENNLYWVRNCTTDNSVEKIKTEYIITLPSEISTTPEMNELFISPFLSRVEEVYYRYGSSNTWELIEGQKSHEALTEKDGVLAYINNNRPFRINFKNINVNQIKIILSSTHFKESETNTRVFTYGLKHIAGFINYYNEYESSNLSFDVSLKDKLGLVVTGIEPQFNNASSSSAYSKDFSFDIFYKDDSGYYHKIIDEFPFVPPSLDLRVKCNFGSNLSSKQVNIKNFNLTYKSNFKIPDSVDLSTILQIGSKGSHVAVLKSDKTVWTWGNNKSGQLSSVTNLGEWDAPNTIPKKVSNLSDVVEISVGLDFTVALKTDGTVWTFGDNFYGQLGSDTNIGTHNPNTNPIMIEGLDNIVSIAAGGWHAMALRSDGAVLSWGYNFYGQLGRENGYGTYMASNKPTIVENIGPSIKIECGFWHSSSLSPDNTVYSWGYNESGQLGHSVDKEYTWKPKTMTSF